MLVRIDVAGRSAPTRPGAAELAVTSVARFAEGQPETAGRHRKAEEGAVRGAGVDRGSGHPGDRGGPGGGALPVFLRLAPRAPARRQPLAPTDPALEFSVLGRREIGGRSGCCCRASRGPTTPSGSPCSSALLTAAGAGLGAAGHVAEEFAAQMAADIVAGVAGGWTLLVRAAGAAGDLRPGHCRPWRPASRPCSPRASSSATSAPPSKARSPLLLLAGQPGRGGRVRDARPDHPPARPAPRRGLG